jgi:hypothetical protein
MVWKPKTHPVWFLVAGGAICYAAFLA